MSEEMYLIPTKLMMCFDAIGRLRKLHANISRDLRSLEREAQYLIAESLGAAQLKQSDEIKELEKLWRNESPAATARAREAPKEGPRA